MNGLLSFCFHQMMKESRLISSDAKMKEANGEIEYVIAGTSHVLAIQEKELPNAINIGTYAEAIHQTYYKLHYLLNKEEVSIDNIIFSYDLELLKKSDVDNLNYQYYWNKYENKPELIKFSDSKLDFTLNRIATFLFPYKDGEVDAFDYLSADEKNTTLANLRDGSSVPTLNPSAKREINDTCLSDQVSSYGAYYFSKIIALCQAKNVRLNLVRFPVTPNFYFNKSNCFSPDEYYERLQKEYLQDKENIFVLDFHDLYDESNFRDAHHLKGGQIRVDFTHELIHRMNEFPQALK